jgi:phospholipid/cholesterol/gamma-HCH transport system substrate-binding protein
MGQHYISIEGGTDDAPDILAGGSIESQVQPDLSTLMAKLENVAGGVQDLTKSFSSENLSTLLGPVNDFIRANSTNLSAILSNTAVVTYNVAEGRGTVGKLINDDQLYKEALSTVGSLNVAATQARSLMTQAEGIVKNVDAVVGQINAGEGTIGKLVKDDSIFREGALAMTNLREALEKINKGQGSVGKLLNDDSLYKNAKLTLQKLDKATEGLEDQGPLSVLGIAVGNLF